MNTKILAILVLSAIFLLGAVPGCLATDRYVPCGGPTPCYATIQAAVNNASAYDTIYVAAGTYIENVNIPSGKDYLRLVGHSKDDTIIEATTTGIFAKSPVIIQGFHITTAAFTSGIKIKANGNATNPGIIQDNKIDHLTRGILFQSNQQYWEIKNNEITYCTSGIYFESASHILVSENTFSECGAGCGGIEGDDVQIVWNNFAGSTVCDSHAIGFCAGVPTNLLISHNQITGHTYGIWAQACQPTTPPPEGPAFVQGTVVDGVKVTCNNIEGNSDYGILNDGTCELNAENNYWGHYTGPSHSPGSGDSVSANVDFEPWLSTPFEYCPECGGAAQLPAFGTLGVVSLIGLLSVVLAVAILRKRE
jgi:parallel beta-helix repeat protein